MRILREVSLADSFSVLNALFGFTAICYLLLYGIRLEAFVLFYLSILIDGIDGFIAKKTERSPFGKELDSLADSISFGVFPAFSMIVLNIDLFPFAALVVAMTILRLARFNVISHENFLGIPSVATAILLTSMIRVGSETTLIAIASFILSFLMISDFEYLRIKDRLALGVIAGVIISSIFFRDVCYLLIVMVLIYAISPFPKEVMEWRRRRVLQRLLSRQE
jgi:CDP-diacylglycerol--serine O-phosphatidyltransferase